MERNYLRFLWYDDVFSDFPKLKRLRYEYDQAFAEKIENSFYVDNFSGGDTSFETALDLYKNLRVRFAEGYFNLRK